MKGKIHILLLYSHNPSRLSHLRKIHSLSERYSFTLIADKSAPYDLLTNFVDSVILIQMNAIDDEFLKLCNKIREREMPHGIVNISEACVPLHSMLSLEFQLIGPSKKAAETARNKYIMRQFCESVKIPVPKFILSSLNNSDYNDLTFPVVAKPVIGGGSTLIRRYNNPDDLHRDLQNLQEIACELYKKDIYYRNYLDDNGRMLFVIEEIIGGETQFTTQFPYLVGEISIESICYQGEVTVLTIHDKPIPGNGPYFEEYIWSTPTRIPTHLQEKALEYVTRIHHSLGDGCYVLHTEFRTFKDDLVLLEFGARLGGGPIYKSLLHATHNDYIEILIALSLGEKPNIDIETKIPTITHCLWAERDGKIASISGESKVIWDIYYIEHQLYDDIGEQAVRAPRSCRSNGHIVYQTKEDGFGELEKHVIDGVRTFLYNLE